MSVVVHEVSHGYAARSLGDRTAEYAGRLTLNPLKHIDWLGSVILPLLLVFSGSSFLIGWAKPVPYNPYNLRNQKWGEAYVAGAGPLSNIILALFFGLIIRFGSYGILPPAFIEISFMIVLINIVLAIFNLVPIPPLDGSKILFSFLPQRLQILRRDMERYSLVFLVIFIFFLWQFLTPVIGYFFRIITGISF